MDSLARHQPRRHRQASRDVDLGWAETTFRALFIDLPRLLLAALREIGQQLFDFGKGVGGEIARGIESVIKDIPVLGDAYSAGKSVIGGAVGAAQGAIGGAASFFGIGAEGAIVSRPTLSLIGEAGPEAVIPLHRMPGASPLPAGGAQPQTVNITVNVQGDVLDDAELGSKVYDALVSHTRRSGPLNLAIAT